MTYLQMKVDSNYVQTDFMKKALILDPIARKALDIFDMGKINSKLLLPMVNYVIDANGMYDENVDLIIATIYIVRNIAPVTSDLDHKELIAHHVNRIYERVLERQVQWDFEKIFKFKTCCAIMNIKPPYNENFQDSGFIRSISETMDEILT